MTPKITKHKFNLLRARFGEWLTARNYSPRTRPDYDRSIRDFLFWISNHTNVVNVSNILPQMIQSYQISLCHPSPTEAGKPVKTLSLSAQAGRLAAIKTFFKWLLESEQIAYNPAAGIQPPKLPESLPRDVLTQAEARRLMEQTPIKKPIDIRDRAILETLYATGIRRAELLDLTIYDADLNTAILRIEKGKGGSGRVVPLTTSAVAALKLYLTDVRGKYLKTPSQISLFVSTRSGRGLSDNDLLRIVKKAARRASIKKKITPHTLRYSCATHLLQGHADIRKIQKLLGHKKLSTTEIYTRVEIGDLAEVVARCHPREKAVRRIAK